MWIRQENSKFVELNIGQREKLENLVQSKEKMTTENAVKLQKNFNPPEKNNYEQRFKAQKIAIKKLSRKLEVQNQVIDNLKLGIIEKQTLKSLEESKIEIREIFSHCSVKVRCKLAPPVAFNETFMISTRKAPESIKRMEQRALERIRRREIIMERKHIIEENRKRLIQEAIESKRVQDDEKKKRNLELIKERRRKELEIEKARQKNKLIHFEKLKNAQYFYEKKLLKKGFEKIKKNSTEQKNNYLKSVEHYERKIIRVSFGKWQALIERLYKDKYKLAQQVFSWNIISRTFKIWQGVNYTLNILIIDSNKSLLGIFE